MNKLDMKSYYPSLLGLLEMGRVVKNYAKVDVWDKFYVASGITLLLGEPEGLRGSEGACISIVVGRRGLQLNGVKM